jgi:tetratricopeptide (TPR) repeat protein
VLNAQREQARAESAFAEAVPLLRALVRDFPDDPIYRSELGGTLCNWSDLPLRQGDYPRFWLLIDESLEQLHRLLEQQPGSAKHQQYLRVAYQRAIWVLVEQGRHGEAAEHAERSLQRLDEARDHLAAARWLAQSAELARHDDKLGLLARVAQAVKHAARAVEHLRSAQQRGADLDVLDGDDAFRILRERADVRALRRVSDNKR